MTTLYVRDESGYCEASADLVIANAQGLIARRYRAGNPVLASPERTRVYLKLHLGALDYEMFGCLWLDNRQKLLAVEDLFRGTITSAAVYPREVVKAALQHGASSCILFHNHPAGVSEPSQADELITRRVREAVALVDVKVIDHLIVGETIYSMAEAGLL
jgi:DNA repair protein RadC